GRRADHAGHPGADLAAARHRPEPAADPGTGRAPSRGDPRTASRQTAATRAVAALGRRRTGHPLWDAARDLRIRGYDAVRHASRDRARPPQAAEPDPEAVLQPDAADRRAPHAGAHQQGAGGARTRAGATAE